MLFASKGRESSTNRPKLSSKKEFTVLMNWSWTAFCIVTHVELLCSKCENRSTSKSLGTSSWEVDWGTCGYKVVRKITMTNCKQEVVWLRHMTWSLFWFVTTQLTFLGYFRCSEFSDFDSKRHAYGWISKRKLNKTMASLKRTSVFQKWVSFRRLQGSHIDS